MQNMSPCWPLNKPNHILIRMPNWLGDLVMATPVLEDIRKHWPEAKITAICQANVANLLKYNPHIDEIYSYQRPNQWIHRVQHLEIIDYLRHEQYDLGLLLTNSFSSAWWFWRGNVSHRIGYAAHMRSFLLNKAVRLPKNLESQHLVKTYKMLLEPMGIALSNTQPALYVSPEEQINARNHLKSLGVDIDKQILIGINPGAAYGSAKCWLPDRFKALTHRLLQNPNYRVIFFGDQIGSPLVHQICHDMPERVINLAGKTTLRELISLIQTCHVFLTNDSGPMHIAAALKTPLVALFGSTSDIKTGPSYGISKVIHKHVECSPCYKRKCPIDFRCMKRIEVEEVYNEIQKLILLSNCG
jgi:heptosyltransferase II